MSSDRVRDHIDHMLEAARQAVEYAQDQTIESFVKDKRTQQAVVLNLILIGEQVTRLMNVHADFVDSHPQIPWRNMKGMRNRIAHNYFEVDLEIVWETVQSALPDLISELDSIRTQVD